MWSPVSSTGLPLLRIVPVAASSAQVTAPNCAPIGVWHPPPPSGVHGVPTSSTPPAVTVGDERTTMLVPVNESGPNAVCHASENVVAALQPVGRSAMIPAGSIDPPALVATLTYSNPVSGEYAG